MLPNSYVIVSVLDLDNDKTKGELNTASLFVDLNSTRTKLSIFLAVCVLTVC